MRPPVWLHMDIMADNIQMIPYSEDKQIPGLFDLSQLACVNKVCHLRQLQQLPQEVNKIKYSKLDNGDSPVNELTYFKSLFWKQMCGFLSNVIQLLTFYTGNTQLSGNATSIHLGLWGCDAW